MWEAPLLQEFGRAVPTAWNLSKQCVEPDRSRMMLFSRCSTFLKCQMEEVLTQSEVLHFVGWLPYLTRDQFDEYRAEHPELEPFPPYDFGVS